MGTTKPKSSRQKPGGKSPSPGGQAKKKAKDRKTRPHSILLADLFLWISVVDECLYHPTGAFDRAARTEGYGSLGNVANRLKVLEARFGKLFQENKASSRYRSGVPTPRGAALAEIFVLIELLYSWAENSRTKRTLHRSAQNKGAHSLPGAKTSISSPGPRRFGPK